MQSLGLNNNKRKKTMNSYFSNTANGNIVQSPISFEPTKNTLNGGYAIIQILPFFCFNKQRFFMSLVHFNDRLCSILSFNEFSQFRIAIASISNDILRRKSSASR
jgi:hypothetical protein